MAVFKYSSFSCILMLIICVATVRASKLNVPRILLPIFRDFSVNFTLEATEGGCYKWYRLSNAFQKNLHNFVFTGLQQELI